MPLPALAVPLITSGIGALTSWLGGRRRSTAQQQMEGLTPQMLEQARQNWGMANQQYPQADWMWQRYLQMLQDNADEVPEAPDQLQATGSQIYGGENTVASRRARTADLLGAFQDMETPDDNWASESGYIDDIGRGIGATYDTVESLLGNSAAQQTGRIQDLRARLLANIGGSFGTARRESDAAYGNARGEVTRGYDDLTRQVGDSEAQQLKAVESLQAYSPQNQSRVARSFSPALASAAMRLRRMGVGTDTMEGNAVMSDVETARARAMDDSAADDNQRYVGAKLDTVRQALAQRLGLGTSRIGLTTDLDTRRADIARGLTLGEGEATRGADATTTGALNAVTQQTTAGQVDNANVSQDRATDAYRMRVDAARRRLENRYRQLNAQAALADRGNSDDDYSRQVSAQNYEAGRGASDWRRSIRLSNASLFGQAGDTMFRRGQDFARQGNQAAGVGYGQASQDFDRQTATSSSPWGAVGSMVGAVGDYFANRPATAPRVPSANPAPNFQANIAARIRRGISGNPFASVGVR